MIIIPEAQLEPITHLRGSFFVINYIHKNLYLRCLIGFNYFSEYVTISFLNKLDEMNNTMVVYKLTICYILFVYLYLNHLYHFPQLLLVSLKFEMIHFSGVIASKCSSTFSINSCSTHSMNWVCFGPVCVSCSFCLILGAFCIASALHIFLQCILSIPQLQVFQVVVHLMMSQVVHLDYHFQNTSFVLMFYCTSTPFWPSITNRYDVGYFGK